MSSILTVALLQIEAAGYDRDENLRRGDAACRQAASLGVDIALFPEMWNIGYAFAPGGPAADSGPVPVDASPEPVFVPAGATAESTFVPARTIPEAALEQWRGRAVARHGSFVTHFARLAAQLGMAIAVTYLEEWPAAARDAVTVLDRRGRDVLTYAKVHTCDFDWPEAALTPGDAFPVAALDTAAGPVRVGAMICFDREFPETARILALEGAEVILVPNACPMEDNRTGQLRARAFENMVAIALANYPATHEDCDGHSVAFDPCICTAGEVTRDTTVVRAGGDEEIVLARFDLDEIRAWRAAQVWGGAFRRPQRYGRLVSDTVAEPFRRRDAAGRPYDPRRR